MGGAWCLGVDWCGLSSGNWDTLLNWAAAVGIDNSGNSTFWAWAFTEVDALVGVALTCVNTAAVINLVEAEILAE